MIWLLTVSNFFKLKVVENANVANFCVLREYPIIRDFRTIRYLVPTTGVKI